MVRKPAQQRRRTSTTLASAKKRAKKEGWLKYVRQGDGQVADEKAMMAGCVFDIGRANHVVEFFERYGVLTEGPWKGQPFHLLDWQREWLMRGFGWIQYSQQWEQWCRRFKYMYLEVPKKSGKTPMVATLGNYLLFADSYGRQINQFLAATTRRQAERCIKHAIRAIKYRRDLEAVSVVKKLEGFYSVEMRDNLWQVVAADPASADGINGHVLADELHRWKGHEFFNTLRWALATQPEGVFVGITTAGQDMDGVCRSCHDKTKNVNAGHQTDKQWFGKIFAADPDDDPHDEKTWYKANPSLGTKPHHPIKLETFRADYETAKSDPTQWPAFLQLRLNVWRTGTDTWMPIEQWDMGEAARSATRKKKPIDCYEAFDEDTWDLKLVDSVMAFDGATIRDTTSAVFTFEHPEDPDNLITLPYFWLPQARAEELSDRVPYQQWAKAGLVTLTPGDAVDFDTIFIELSHLIKKFGTDKFYFDPMFQAEWLTQKLEDETGATRYEFPQTITNYSPAMKTAQRMILENRLKHNGHPILNWQLGNTVAKTNANGDIRPVKQKHGDFRTIDGVVSMIMTMRNWLTIEHESFYSENDLEMF